MPNTIDFSWFSEEVSTTRVTFVRTVCDKWNDDEVKKLVKWIQDIAPEPERKGLEDGAEDSEVDSSEVSEDDGIW